nr:MAG TPA: hypothetical protein [Caudoviricetes sp.]
MYDINQNNQKKCQSRRYARIVASRIIKKNTR